MRFVLAIFITTTLAFYSAFGQGIEKLKLIHTEVPEWYKPTNEMLNQSLQAKTFYEKTDSYKNLIGKIKKKEFQSYVSKEDKGTIYYFEFEENFKQQPFLEGLIWGGKKPTKEHPEEYFVKDKILVIWSFSENSELKYISKKKVMPLLK